MYKYSNYISVFSFIQNYFNNPHYLFFTLGVFSRESHFYKNTGYT